jgi:Alpha-2,8-polysialyltransferase (POLYST)
VPYVLSTLAVLATMHPSERISTTILFQLPWASKEDMSEMLRIARELLAGNPLIERVEGLTDEELKSVKLHDFLGADFDDFYYNHDAVGIACRTLAAAYPRARRICMGDAFGLFYRSGFIESYQRKVSTIQRIRDWFLGSGELAPVRPDVAALVLPVDASGVGLRGLQLVVCPKQAFVQAIHDCHANARALHEHMHALLARTEGRTRYLLLGEPYAEAGHVKPEREVDMFCEIVRTYCKPGSAIIVKPHPMEKPGKAARIGAALGAGYDVIAVDARFDRYPIEIWQELVRACTVICTSYSVLSLKYSQDIDVVQPMNDAFIDKWIEPAHRKWTRDGLRLFMEPLARLGGWDGRSVLWSGKP